MLLAAATRFRIVSLVRRHERTVDRRFDSIRFYSILLYAARENGR